MKREAVVQSNASILISGARVVVVGGTQGIGEGVAARFARAGAEVWIVGRNESKANTVLEKLKATSQEHKIAPAPMHHFIKADLSLIAEAKRVAEDIRANAGPQGVDYLVMCHGGPPNGTFKLTSEGHEEHYAVQVLSRFILAYKLAVEATPVVTKGVLSVMGPGKVLKTVDYDDLEQVKAHEEGNDGIFSALSRDTVSVDILTEELAQRNGDVIFTHVFPGAVKTNYASNNSLPWYLNAVSKVALLFMGETPESYAEVPFYILANPKGRAATADAPFWNEKVDKLEPDPSTREKSNRTKVWDNLMATLGPPLSNLS
ncbi:NAD(P)-binding protein [Ramaria rubella]|nr:NAD(P)-binding protein [Ramaria rubella]